MGVKTHNLTERDIKAIKRLDECIENLKITLEETTGTGVRQKVISELVACMSYRDTAYPVYPKPVSSVDRSDQSYADEDEELFLANLRNHVTAHEADGDYRTAEALKSYINTHIAKTAEFKANPPADMWPRPAKQANPLANVPGRMIINGLVVFLGAVVGSIVHFF